MLLSMHCRSLPPAGHRASPLREWRKPVMPSRVVFWSQTDIPPVPEGGGPDVSLVTYHPEGFVDLAAAWVGASL
jgi:hypothetical protein